MIQRYSELDIASLASSRGYNVGPAYHGTSASVSEFQGFRPNFFTLDKKYAKMYVHKGKGRKKILCCFLSIRNPFDPRKSVKEIEIFNQDFPEYWGKRFPSLMDAKLFEPFKIKAGELIPFQWADQFFTFLRIQKREQNWGYDSIFVNEGDFPAFMGSSEKMSIVPLSNTQIKLADPTTYDDAGNPIPLSERFNPNTSDIRY